MDEMLNSIEAAGEDAPVEIDLVDLVNFSQVRDYTDEELVEKIDELNKLTDWARENCVAPSDAEVVPSDSGAEPNDSGVEPSESGDEPSESGGD